MNIQKWKLISKKDVSPHSWFPIEMRTYQLPNGKVVDDFSVTTIADVALIVPITNDNKVILVKQYKPGVDEVMIEFPAGRIEPEHINIHETAHHELEEETGIKVAPQQLKYFGRLTGFSTKASEIVSLFLATNCEFNSIQNFDDNEDIEVLKLDFNELDEMIVNGAIWSSQTIAAWELVKKKFTL